MADFRIHTTPRDGSYGLAPEDESRIRRFIRDENARTAEANLKRPPKDRTFPIDEEFMVYAIGTGDAKQRNTLLNQLKERYPSPPIATTGIPIVREGDPQVDRTPVTTSPTRFGPSDIGISMDVASTNLNAQEVDNANDRNSAFPTGSSSATDEKQSTTPSPWTPEQQAIARTSIDNFIGSGEYDPKVHSYENMTKIGVEAIEEVDRLNDTVRTYDGGIPVVDNQSPASVSPTSVASDTSTNPPSSAQTVRQEGFEQVGPGVEENIKRALEQRRPDWRETGVYRLEISGFQRPIVSSSADTAASDTDSSLILSGPRPNPLRDYAAYTYNLSLRALTINDFNSIVEDPKSVREKTKNILVASGGIRSNELPRAPEFNEDFFFDRLNIETVIGLNSRGRGSNVVKMDFTIIEPYGITFINRLLKVADRLGIYRWDEMPFILTIDFFGTTDDMFLKQVKLESQTKFLPIRIIDIKIKLTAQGSEYQVTAVPYGHQAYAETVGTTPINLEVTATTLADFFDVSGNSGDVEKISAAEDAIDKQREETIELSKLDSGQLAREMRTGAIKQASKQTAALRNSYFKVGSYSSALAKYQQVLVNKGAVEYPDVYTFTVDKDISDAKVTESSRNNVRSSPMSNNNNEKSTILDGIKAQVGITDTVVSTDKMVFPINAGTNIIEVVNQAVRTSSYITSQISSTPEKDKPINWYKILPTVKLGEYDKKRMTYRKYINYDIRKYVYYNTKYPYANKSNPSSWVKEYDYIFTGKNESIIDLNIDFNTAFYVAIQSLSGKSLEASGPSTDDIPDWDRIVDPMPKLEIDKTISPLRYHPTSGNNEQKSSYDKTSDQALDFFKSVLSSARGDMINIQMKIIGDPEFIKQDDLLYVDSQTTSRVIDQFGSLVTDAGEIFVYLNFKTPSDVNQKTGLMDFDTWKNESSFNGVYKIITVTSEFSRGQFVQNLDLIRVFGEDPKQVKNSAESKDEIRENQTNNVTPNENETSALSSSTASDGFYEWWDDDSTRANTSRARSTDIAADAVNVSPDSSIEQVKPDVASVAKVSGDKIKIPGPRRIPSETALDEDTPLEKFKQDIDTLKSKVTSAVSSIGDAARKLERSIFAPDPNAPPYTGNDPIVRRRLGLPEVDLGAPSASTANLTDEQVNQQINNIIRGE